MLNMLKIFPFIVIFSLSGQTFSSSQVSLSEDLLKDYSAKGSPQLDQIQAAFLAVDIRKGDVNEAFAPELFGKASYIETNEKPIIQFIPIFSPIKQVQMGVRQNMQGGFSAEASVSADQRSANSPTAGKFNNVTTTILSFTLQMDLWKDLFGRLSKSKIENALLDSKRAALERDIQMKAFHISLRRIYWSLVANQEAIGISQALLKTAKQQAIETGLRFKNSVAEADEVAGYEAQVASRKGTLTYLQYQRETLIKQLKNLLPELSDSEIVLSKYSLDETFDQVMGCAATIAKEQKVPYHFTKYDEATEMIRAMRTNSSVLNSRYSDPDVKLYGAVKSTGVGSDANGGGFRGSYGSALDDMQTNNRAGYVVGLSFSVPLGDVKQNNQRTKEVYDEKRLSAAINSNDAQMVNTHQQLVRSVTLLNEMILNQKVSSQQLDKKLKFMQRKYQQARASVNDLIQNQDALLNSELATIETRLQILNVLFDYLVIYTETPCEFNRI